MRNRTKVLFTALTAALVLGAMVGPAWARRFETSEQRIRVVWPATERLKFTAFGGTIVVRCEVTLEGSFHSKTISKVSGQLVGYITSANLTRPCEGGEAFILNGVERPTNTLPWHIRYDRFAGTLPAIERIRVQLVGAAFLVEAAAECLFASTAASPAFGFIELNAAGQVTGLRADETSSIPRQITLAGFCPANGSFAGRGNVTVQGGTGTVTVKLVQ